MHEISIPGDFSEVDFVSVSDVISACDFNDKDFSLTTVAVEVLLQIYLYVLFIDFSYISACVGCCLWILIHIFTPVNVVVSLGLARVATSKGGVKV